MKIKNKDVEKFFLETLPKNEDVTMTECTLWLHNYYKEVENDEAFNSKYYDNQDERMDTMFFGMPENALNLLKFKAYKHRAGHHEETGHEERIKELETEVNATVYEEFAVRKWWN